MKINTDHEKLFFNYFLSKPNFLKNLGNSFFKNKDLDFISRLARDFYFKFGEAPSREQTKALLVDEKTEVSNDIVDTIYDINIKEYDKDWLQRTSEAWIKWRHFNKQLIKTVEYVKTQNVSPDNVENVVQQGISMLSTDGSLSFNNDIGLDFFNPEDHKQHVTQKMETGWDFIDRVSGGGYDLKSLVVYAGPSNIGKCTSYNTLITVRNKKTGKKMKVKIGDFMKKIKNKHKTQ